MSRRKLNRTNLEQGENRQDHHWKTVNFCPKCHAHGYRNHYDGCDGEWVRIIQDAQVPKRRSSKRTWNFFIRKFVDKEFKLKYQEGN